MLTMTKTINIMPPKGDQPGIDLELSDDNNEVFVDGVTSLAVGYPNSKLVCTTNEVNTIGSGNEIRREAVRLVMPTSTLIDIANLIHSQVNLSRQGLLDNAEKQKQRLESLLSNIMVTPTVSESEN